MKIVNMFFDIEKEEHWLNKKLHEGYCCTAISGLGIYTFKRSDKNYVMRLDYQDYLPKGKFMEYKAIYHDYGWDHIAGSRLGGRQYWQKEKGDQNEIFSDRQSKRNYYKKLMNYSFWLGLLCLYIAFSIYKDGVYLTDGLWSMEGSWFWKALLFETPFVLLRSFPALMAILFGASFYRAYRKYTMLSKG